jgi:hypothetical protein
MSKYLDNYYIKYMIQVFSISGDPKKTAMRGGGARVVAVRNSCNLLFRHEFKNLI